MTEITFDKYQGLGNDFILFDLIRQPEFGSLSANSIRELCDRRFGVGADGVLLFDLDGENNVRMIYFNADGSRAETCFNGIRCTALHAVRSGIRKSGIPFIMITDAGEVEVDVADDMCCVTQKMRGPSFDPVHVQVDSREPFIDKTLDIDGKSILGTALSMGNPHLVCFQDGKSLEQLNLVAAELGKDIEQHKLFPAGVNVEFASVSGNELILMAVWERGVGITLACGSGASAMVCAAVKTGRIEPEKNVTVRMKGGELLVTVASDFEYLTARGSANHVFSGTADQDNLGKKQC